LAANWNLQVPRAFLIWSIKENANHEIQKADLANPWFEFQSQFWFLKFLELGLGRIFRKSST